MKLTKGETVVRVYCYSDCGCGYKDSQIYVFPNMGEVENFMGIRDNYKEDIYFSGTDIFGNKRKVGSYEYIGCIKEETEYEVKYDER